MRDILHSFKKRQKSITRTMVKLYCIEILSFTLPLLKIEASLNILYSFKPTLCLHITEYLTIGSTSIIFFMTLYHSCAYMTILKISIQTGPCSYLYREGKKWFVRGCEKFLPGPEATPIKCAGRESAGRPTESLIESAGSLTYSLIESVGKPAEHPGKARQKFLATMYKIFPGALYSRVQSWAK